MGFRLGRVVLAPGSISASAKRFMEGLWYEENAHIPGCFQGDGIGEEEGRGVGVQ